MKNKKCCECGQEIEIEIGKESEEESGEMEEKVSPKKSKMDEAALDMAVMKAMAGKK